MDYQFDSRDEAIATDQLTSLGLSVATQEALTAAGLDRLSQLAYLDPDLLQARGLSEEAIEELKRALLHRGLRFADHEEHVRPEAGMGAGAEASLREQRRRVEAQGRAGEEAQSKLRK